MVVLRSVFRQFPLKLRLLIAFTNGFLLDMSCLGYFGPVWLTFSLQMKC